MAVQLDVEKPTFTPSVMVTWPANPAASDEFKEWRTERRCHTFITDGRVQFLADCTPGYYNNEGQDPGPAAKLNVGYPAGASAYFQYIDGWRKSGQFEGLEFR